MGERRQHLLDFGRGKAEFLQFFPKMSNRGANGSEPDWQKRVSHPDPGWTISRARLRHSTILSALGPNHAFTVLFLGTHTRTSQWITYHGNAFAHTRTFQWVTYYGNAFAYYSLKVTHHGNALSHATRLRSPIMGTHTRTFQWVTYYGNAFTCYSLKVTHHGNALGNALACYSLNFGVPMEPKASELLKGLMVGRDENIHISLRGSTPLSDVGSYREYLIKLLSEQNRGGFARLMENMDSLGLQVVDANVTTLYGTVLYILNVEVRFR